jgi:hypothetical protein
MFGEQAKDSSIICSAFHFDAGQVVRGLVQLHDREQSFSFFEEVYNKLKAGIKLPEVRCTISLSPLSLSLSVCVYVCSDTFPGVRRLLCCRRVQQRRVLPGYCSVRFSSVGGMIVCALIVIVQLSRG